MFGKQQATKDYYIDQYWESFVGLWTTLVYTCESVAGGRWRKHK